MSEGASWRHMERLLPWGPGERGLAAYGSTCPSFVGWHDARTPTSNRRAGLQLLVVQMQGVGEHLVNGILHLTPLLLLTPLPLCAGTPLICCRRRTSGCRRC